MKISISILIITYISIYDVYSQKDIVIFETNLSKKELQTNIIYIGEDEIRCKTYANTTDLLTIPRNIITSVESNNLFKNYLLNEKATIDLAGNKSDFIYYKIDAFRKINITGKWFIIGGLAVSTMGSIAASKNASIDPMLFLNIGTVTSLTGLIIELVSFKKLRSKKYYDNYIKEDGYYFNVSSSNLIK